MKISSKEIAIIGLMLALALALDVMPVEMPTVWGGMKIDLVAVPIVVAYFILGFWGGLITLAMLFLGLSVVSSASWLGAMMKTLATFGVLIGLEVARRTVGFDYSNKKRLVVFGLVAYIVGILIRIPPDDSPKLLRGTPHLAGSPKGAGHLGGGGLDGRPPLLVCNSPPERHPERHRCLYQPAGYRARVKENPASPGVVSLCSLFSVLSQPGSCSTSLHTP